MDSPACGLGYCEDCGVDCGVRDRDDDAAIETLRVMLLERAAMYANKTIPIWSFGRSGPDMVPDPRFNERRACIAIALALLL